MSARLRDDTGELRLPAEPRPSGSRHRRRKPKPLFACHLRQHHQSLLARVVHLRQAHNRHTHTPLGCGLCCSFSCRGMEAELSGGSLSERTCQGGCDAD
jgi:hypothetical protein